MNVKFQTRIQRYGWDKAICYYESGWKESLAPAHKKLLEFAAPQPAETVLDIACGTGLITFPLADAVGPTGHVIATDLSDRMVNSVMFESFKRPTVNIRTFRANAESLPMLADNSCDLITCALGLMYCTDPMKAMQEVFRILKPNGRAVFAVWGERKKCGWADVFPIVDRRVKSTVCPMFFHLGTGNTLAEEMVNAGFTETSHHRLSTSLQYKDANSAFKAAFIGGPVALAYNRFDRDTREAVRAEYLDSISSYFVHSGYTIPGEFVICRGIKPKEVSG